LPDQRVLDALAAIDSWPVPHASAAVVSADGSIATHGDVDHVYRLASISKVITGWTVLIACEEGSVSLEDSCGPEGATLRHCLAHAAGYGFDTPGPIVGVAKRRIYSNTGIEAAAAHVETRTGIPFADYMHEAVFEPLSMTSSRLKASPAYAVFSTVRDMCRFAAELLNPTLVSIETARDAVTPQWPDLAGVIPGLGSFRPNPWGLGIEIRGDKSPHWTGSLNSPLTFGHFGGSGTMMWVDPAIHTALVALTDRMFDEWAADALSAWPALSDAVVKAINT
jgi:CubicO group peptidase (beta-lactamase class C family)